MSETKVPKKDAASSSSSSSKNSKRPRKLNPLPTKIVIRHLPPTLTSEQFIEQVSPISDHNYYYYVCGDLSLGQFSFSRAYINFINQEDILHFREKFENYIFVDDKGQEYAAIVELALYQGVPKRMKKIDPRCKTIETDPNFLQFVEEKENKTEMNLPTVQDCLEEIEAKEKEGKSDHHQMTPLLEYINNANKFKQSEVKKKTSRDDRRDDKKKKDENKRKRERDHKSKLTKSKEWQPAESSSVTVIKPASKEVKEIGTKEPRRRFRRRRDDRRKEGSSLKPVDEKGDNKEYSKPARTSRTGGLASSSSTRNEDTTKATHFTVEILSNEKRSSAEATASSSNNTSTNAGTFKSTGDSLKKGTESSRERLNPGEKVRNKDRPAIQLYRPLPRSSSSSSKDPAQKKPSQEKSSSSSRRN